MQVNGMDNASPESSIDTGSSMLAQYYKQTGSVDWALAMYNMGPGILDWAKQNGYSDPRAAMPAFSQYMMQQNGYSVYGDPQYIQHVSRYLN